MLSTWSKHIQNTRLQRQNSTVAKQLVNLHLKDQFEQDPEITATKIQDPCTASNYFDAARKVSNTK